MKLWEKGSVPNRSVIEFTSADDRITDMVLAEWDIVGSMAHVIMLHEIGLLGDQEKTDLLKALYALFERASNGRLLIEDGVEDIHSQVEKELTLALGDTGRKIHTGRSRNDQVLVDLRLYLIREMDALAANTERLFLKWQELSERYRNIMIPGYTHMQPAMPSSLGMWFGAYAESLCDDIAVLAAARTLNNRNPLGTGAGFGSTLPLNRRLTTKLLGFDGLMYNSAYASLNRGKAEMALASAMAGIAQTLSRFAMDVCLYMTPEYAFISFPDEFVTGSSIMPQKKNPDVFELIRGRANLVQTLPSQIAGLVSNLPSGYNRDLQLLKKLIITGFSELKACIDITLLMLEHIRINENILCKPQYNPIFSTETVNQLVREGVPFRSAYKMVSEMASEGSFRETSVQDYTHEGSLGNLCNVEIKNLFYERMKSFKSKSARELADDMLAESL